MACAERWRYGDWASGAVLSIKDTEQACRVLCVNVVGFRGEPSQLHGLFEGERGNRRNHSWLTTVDDRTCFILLLVPHAHFSCLAVSIFPSVASQATKKQQVSNLALAILRYHSVLLLVFVPTILRIHEKLWSELWVTLIRMRSSMTPSRGKCLKLYFNN